MQREKLKMGRPWPELATEMTQMAQGDLDWRHGRHGSYVWYADDALEDVARQAYSMFIVENGLNTKAFPSLMRMETEVVDAVLAELGATPECAGHMTSGGTESIFLATYAAREWARTHRPDISKPRIVAASSAHPGINKAACYLGMEVTRVPVREDYRADAVAMEAALSDDVVMLYASAPAYSVGIIDPIHELGTLTLRHNLWLHVDACVGGILAPFVRKAGYPVPEFDFSVPGVMSISADLHKSGFASKGASIVLFRSKELQEHARYQFRDWPSADYSTLTFTGTRPGGAIASAWAVQQYLGQDGYLDIARKSMLAREIFEKGLADIADLHTLGVPDLWALCFGSDTVDMTLVQKHMAAKGWRIGGVVAPRGLHMMFTPVHLPYVGEMLHALELAVKQVQNGETTPTGTPEIRYS